MDVDYLPAKNSECKCELCLMSKRINKFHDSLPEEFREEFKKITDELRLELNDVDTDLAVLKSKIIGKWTSDIEIIEGKKYKVTGELVK